MKRLFFLLIIALGAFSLYEPWKAMKVIIGGMVILYVFSIPFGFILKKGVDFFRDKYNIGFPDIGNHLFFDKIIILFIMFCTNPSLKFLHGVKNNLVEEKNMNVLSTALFIIGLLFILSYFVMLNPLFIEGVVQKIEEKDEKHNTHCAQNCIYASHNQWKIGLVLIVFAIL